MVQFSYREYYVLSKKCNVVELENFGKINLVNFIDMSSEEKKCVLNIRNHPDVRMWMYDSEEISQDEHLKFIESLKDNLTRQYFLVKQTHFILGVVYFNIDTKCEAAEFGLYANPMEAIKGKGSALQETVIIYAFNYLKVSTLKLEVYEKNEKAIKLYKKYNFQLVRTEYKNNKSVLYMKLNVVNK
ncbi:MAG: UDP-4-amino-4,6-dideoxy-N-acetyl-beta-L-altrosamine N-acetyltransferase [Oleiphilaceae bacterium]|jgi:UDP-4-amino-4,6-dideoxy-N-acetyl-beta-L-altrosamine N-acetyltransferase